MTSGHISALHFATGLPVRVRWEQGVITHIDSAPAGVAHEWVAPGLFDLQINGYGGIDFQQDNLAADQLIDAVTRLRADGCTRFLLTLISDDWERLVTRLQHLQAVRSKIPELHDSIAGWHIEGPFLSSKPGFCGAHTPDIMRDPKPEDIRLLRSLVPNDPLLLTIAPEREGALDAIKLAVAAGCKVSLGHTDASVDLLRKAVHAGATGFTHLGNACPKELDRHDNVLWRVFETAGLTVSLIADSIHVSPPLFRLVHRVIDPNAIYYTTDAMAAAGSPPGRYTIGPLAIEVASDQIVRQPGKTNFAGSALRPVDGVLRAARMLNVPWHKTWPRFSMRPAQFMGLPSELAVGGNATFCVLRVNEEHNLLQLQVRVRGDLVAESTHPLSGWSPAA